jgi:hypothetical protein
LPQHSVANREIGNRVSECQQSGVIRWQRFLSETTYCVAVSLDNTGNGERQYGESKQDD